MTWFYQNKPVEELQANVYGFIYKLHLAGGLFYIGKKDTISYISKPIKKDLSKRPGHVEFFNKNVTLDPDTGYVVVARKDKARLRKMGVIATRQTYEKIAKESNWKEYESSSDDISDHIIIYKEILEFLPTRRSLTYKEEWWQFNLNILEDDNYINKQIGNRYYRNNLL
jgi:hypothetical protein